MELKFRKYGYTKYNETAGKITITNPALPNEYYGETVIVFYAVGEENKLWEV